MKTYVGQKENKDVYIRRVKLMSGNDNYCKVKYASGHGLLGAINGMREYKIAATDERLENINFYMESEAERGKEKLGTYKRVGACCAAMSSCLTGIAMLAPGVFESAISTAQTQNNLEDIASAIVLAGAASAIASGIAAFVNISKVFEINKLNYRDENMYYLTLSKMYKDSMDCFPKKQQKFFQKTKNPFGVIWSEYYGKRHLKKIVSRTKQRINLDVVQNTKANFPAEEQLIVNQITSRIFADKLEPLTQDGWKLVLKAMNEFISKQDCNTDIKEQLVTNGAIKKILQLCLSDEQLDKKLVDAQPIISEIIKFIDKKEAENTPVTRDDAVNVMLALITESQTLNDEEKQIVHSYVPALIPKPPKKQFSKPSRNLFFTPDSEDEANLSEEFTPGESGDEENLGEEFTPGGFKGTDIGENGSGSDFLGMPFFIDVDSNSTDSGKDKGHQFSKKNK